VTDHFLETNPKKFSVHRYNSLDKSKEFGPEKGRAAPGFSITEKTCVPRIFDIKPGLPEKTICHRYGCRLAVVALEPYLVQPNDGGPVRPDKGATQLETQIVNS
jgi:hypothetical protein